MRLSRFVTGALAVVVLLLVFACAADAQRRRLVRVPGPPFVPDQIVVGLRNGVPSSAVARLGARYQMQEVKHLRKLGARAMRLRSSDQMTSVLTNLRKHPEVRFAEPNYTRRVLLAAPDDPAYNNKDTLYAVWDPADATWYQWGMHQVYALEAWNLYPNTYYTAASKPTNPPKVAVVDTGIDIGGTDGIAHPDFINLGGSSPDAAQGGQVDLADATNVLAGYSPNDVADDYGHGTAVSGVIGAATNNGGGAGGEGIAGLAYHCQILPIKTFDNTGYGTEADLAAAIIWAVDHGALIINVSAGDVYYSQLEQDAVTYAWEHGSLVIAAAGNEGDSMNRPSYPAACAGVMGVGSSTYPFDAPASYSNYGDYVSVAAPGGDVDTETLSFWLCWTMMPTEPVPMHYAGVPDGIYRYQYQTGTSLACPFVSALASLYAASKGITQSTPGGLIQIYQAIQRGCDDAGGVPGWHPYWGWGRINCYQTLLETDNRASTVGAITGQVMYYGTAVQNAVVKATPVGGGKSPGATSRSDGTYRIANIAPGMYNVTATYFGQTKTLGNVEVRTSCDTPRTMLDVDSPRVTSSTPNTGLNTGAVNITDLEGLGFVSGATVKLSKTGAPDIVATSVNVLGFTQIACRVDLTGASAGQWDIVVTNPDGQSGKLANGFTVQSDDTTPPQIATWSVVADHGTAGTITNAATDGYVEPRNSGLASLLISFSEALDPATVSTSSVGIQGVVSGNVSSRVSAAVLQSGNTAVAVTLSPVLPDQDTYTITVADTVKDPAGNALGGDRDLVLTGLKGDVNSTRTVNTLDLMQVRAHVNETVTAANARYDVNNSGTLNTLDLLAARAYSGNSAPAPPSPSSGGTSTLAQTVSTRSVGPGWHLLSVPTTGATADVWLALGEPGTDWSLYELMQGKLTPSLLGSLTEPEAGRGYWVRAVRGGTLGLGVGSQASSESFALDLPEGWSAIGCPVGQAVAWNSGTVQVERDGAVLPLAEAVARGWLCGTLYGYSGGHYVTVEADAAGALLEPWTGYLVCAPAGGKLLISPATDRGGLARTEARRPSAEDWRLRLVASVSGFVDACTTIGRQAGTEAVVAPHPPAGPGVDLWVCPEDASGASPGSALDLRSAGDELTWDVFVHSAQADAPVTVSWPDLSELPADLGAWLLDPASGKRVSLRTTMSYVFTGPSRQLQVEVKPRVVGIAVTSLAATSTRGGGAEIVFSLSAEAEVEAEVVNIAGRPVRTLVAGQACPAGVSRLSWDGRSTSGTRVPSGRYLVCLTARQEDGQQVRRVITVSVGR